MYIISSVMKGALCFWWNLKKKKKNGSGRNDKANCVQYFGVTEVIKSCISKNAVVKENIKSTDQGEVW